MEALVKYWPILSAIVALVFTTGGFYAYVKNTIAISKKERNDLQSHFNLLEKLVKSEIDKMEASITLIQKGCTDRAIELTKQINHGELDREQIKAHIDVLEDKLKEAPQALRRITETLRDVFQKIDEVKKDFVSVQQYRETLEDLRDLRNKLMK